MDHANQALGVMSTPAILEQNLLHRSVAVFLCDRSTRFFLALDQTRGFGFSGFGILPPFISTHDYGLELVTEYVKPQQIGINLFGIYPPCPENYNSFTYVLEASVSCLPSHPVHLSVGRCEYEALADLDYKICPFFRLLVSSGWLIWC